MTRYEQTWQGVRETISPPVFLTWGMFDGVHVGHRRIIRRTVQEANRNNWDSLIITFQEHPRKVLTDSGPGQIISRGMRRRLISNLDPDCLADVPFTEKFASLSPEEFYQDVLRERLGAMGICLGKEARFGHKRSGDVDRLRELAAPDNVQVACCEHAMYGGERISSTRIRESILAGRLMDANVMLGRPPVMEGTVIQGDQRGREIGFPTANLDLHHDITPPKGIYGGRALVDETPHPALASIGVRPVFEGDSRIVHEVHILDFDRDLYGEEIQFFFLEHLREEEAFKTVDELVEQIEQDIKDFRNSPLFPDGQI